ncbi:MAG: chromate efflux transporter [Rhodothermia bacterium]|nr:chromate efflux transporter [Rhodothermia bacterium]
MTGESEDVSGSVDGGRRGPLGEIARLFLRLGVVAFGGPAAHIAMMEDEFVVRRRWVGREHFLDLVGATNLIPGPNSTEMTMHLGYERAGWPGLFTAGASFILPAVTLTAGLAWLYVRYGALPEVEPFLVGIKPAVIVIIAGALWRLGRQAVTGWRLGVIGLAVGAASLFGTNEVTALLVGGIVGMVWLRVSGSPKTDTAARFLPILFQDSTAVAAGAAAAGAGVAVSTWKLGLFFLKIGAILYGSGYVLVAFLEGGLVNDYGWLTEGQLLDAIAIGQFTPGPVLSTSTFIGYLVDGPAGAVVATLGIFLPSFFFVLILNPIIPRLRESVWASAFLDAVNVAAVGLMLAVTIELARATLTSLPAAVVIVAAAVAFFRFRLGAPWLVGGGALLGWMASLIA